jgi:hypothetical protein
MLPIPEYIRKRISRPKPTDACVVLDSTPVVSFGDASKAQVATLGLNPSRCEFEPTARLATNGSSIEKVLEGCNTYFRHEPYKDKHGPYKEWFDKLGPSLEIFHASYEDGSACHLDLVQWATNPTWKGLTPSIRKRLIEEDAPFLECQLRNNENIGLLLVNGSGAWRQLCQSLQVENLQIADSIEGLSYRPTHLYSGYLFGRLRILAWSKNLQSSYGVQKTLWEKELPARLKQLHKRCWG